MIHVADGIWVGTSADARRAVTRGMDAVLNVAQDLAGWSGWPDVEYAQVGLVDGPGNPQAAYCAAVLALATLRSRYDAVLVHCHSGGRAAAVVAMYLQAGVGHGWPGDWSAGWDGWLAAMRGSAGAELPVIHAAHRAAFDAMDWRMLARVIGGTA